MFLATVITQEKKRIQIKKKKIKLFVHRENDYQGIERGRDQQETHRGFEGQ